MNSAERLRYLVLGAQREGNRWLANELKHLSLTPSQAEVLRVLADHEPLTLSELGGMLVCESGTNPSRLVDRLVTTGLVERRALATDRRSVVLSLSAEGKSSATAVSEIEERMFRTIDGAGTPAELAAAMVILERFVDGLPSGAALAAKESGSAA